MTTLATIGSTSFDTLAAAAAAVLTGQTVNIVRSGDAAEATAAFAKPGLYRIIGTKDAAGGLPKLHIDMYTRPAFGKGIINLEAGDYEVAYLHLDGCAVPESNGAGIRLNDTTGMVNVHHVRLTNNENGILSALGTSTLNLSDSVLDANGRASDSGRRGYSHNAYLADTPLFTATRVSFTNSVYGHDLKTRARKNILTQVSCKGSAQGRALDVPNGGVVLATDSEFSKPASATQNNLIDIGAEGFVDGRAEQYQFTNCLFHNDVDPVREVQYIINRSNTEVVLIDPLFTGAAAAKDRKATLVGNIRIVLTGGKLGPRVAAGGDPGATSTIPVPPPGATPTPSPTPSPAPAPTYSPFTILAGDPNAGTWTTIGKENETVTVPDNTVVRYGNPGHYVYARASGKFIASNTVFGKDPAVAKAKTVDVWNPVAGSAPPAGVPVLSDADQLAKVLTTLTGKTVGVTIK